MSETQFPKGISFKVPQGNAPDFVKAKVTIKLDEAIAYLKEVQATGENWLNLDAKVSKQGKAYLSVNTWKPSGQQSGQNDDYNPPQDAPVNFDSVSQTGQDEVPF